MVGITERNQQKLELANAGFSLKYIDDWQPKTALYRHKPSYNVAGDVSEGIGTTTKGVPGNPDYVLRKARIGLFPWPPSGSCECRWCVEVRIEGVAEEGEAEVAEEAAATLSSVPCPDCSFVASAPTGSGASSRLRAHSKTHSREDSYRP
jgi:hypothetical protein